MPDLDEVWVLLYGEDVDLPEAERSYACRRPRQKYPALRSCSAGTQDEVRYLGGIRRRRS
jgi:hypothetical protein